jgi:Leucine-rich repeat (LRR) protein
MKHDFVYFRLSSLQHLSVANNQLIELPVEMCALIRLEEFHVAGNQLTSLPLEFFYYHLDTISLQTAISMNIYIVFSLCNVTDLRYL